MDKSYDFLIYLESLKAANLRFENYISAVNATIISVALYAIALIFRLPAFTQFYWEDSLLLTQLPAILCVFLGIITAIIIRRRQTPDIFRLLGPGLDEKAKTGYDNRDVISLPMRSLAYELQLTLSKINSSQILKRNRLSNRIFAVLLLSGITIFIAHSQIGADITPADLQSLSNLKERAFGSVQDETQSNIAETNLSGNLYGKPSLAVLNEAKMELVLYPGIAPGSRARSTQQIERAFQPSPAVEATAVPSEVYIESLPPQNKEIIKKYYTLLGSISNL